MNERKNGRATRELNKDRPIERTDERTKDMKKWRNNEGNKQYITRGRTT